MLKYFLSGDKNEEHKKIIGLFYRRCVIVHFHGWMQSVRYAACRQLDRQREIESRRDSVVSGI
jgi:hypothetical protein